MFTGTFLYSSNAFVHFLGFLPLGSGSGSESVHADPDPGGKTLSGSETPVRIVLIFKLKMLCNKGKWMMMMFGQIRYLLKVLTAFVLGRLCYFKNCSRIRLGSSSRKN